MDSIKSADGGRAAKSTRKSSPFNQQEWLDSNCGKQDEGTEAVVRACGCGINFSDGSGVDANDAKKHEESEQHTS